MANFQNQSTKRLFSVIAELKTAKECSDFFEDLCTIKEIQDKLGINEDTSSSYKNNITMFRKFVIERAIEEINKYTDIFVSVEYIKKGRSIDSIKFIIKELKFDKAMDNSMRADIELNERLGLV